MKSPRVQLITGIVLVLASLAVLIVAIPAMADRLASERALKDREFFRFLDPIDVMEFNFDGRPVRIERIEASLPEEQAALRIHWRSQTVDFPIIGHDDPRLPGLLEYSDWFRVLRMAVGTGSSEEVDAAIERGEIRPQTIFAARYPPEGFDPETWGIVRRKDWRYRFAEILREGPDESAIVVQDLSYREIEDMPRSWQYQAMLQITPALNYPKNRFVDDGMSAMGWTWPASGVSILTLIIGGLLIGASRIRQGQPPHAE